MAKLFFAVDVHGSTVVWRKWIKTPEIYKVDTLILAGDLTGKALVPLIKQPDGTWRSSYFGRTWVMRNEEEIKSYQEKLEGAGIYHFKTTREEVEEMKNNPKLVGKMIKEKMVERLRGWIEFLLSNIDTKKTMVVVMPGNDDEFVIDPVIKSFEDRGIIYPLDKVFEIEGHEVISSAYANPTPWNTPREMEEKDLEKHLKKHIDKLKNVENSIFNFHVPPYGTRLDLAPKLSKDLKIETVAGSVEYVHVGSKAVRKLEEKYQPMLGLHGHIHESTAIENIGRTLCLNPGSEYGEGILRGFIIEISRKGVENYWRVEG
ncbi:MAG: metallophosphoesterase family protein [Candidatus Freyarchaeota archaeon]